MMTVMMMVMVMTFCVTIIEIKMIHQYHHEKREIISGCPCCITTTGYWKARLQGGTIFANPYDHNLIIDDHILDRCNSGGQRKGKTKD